MYSRCNKNDVILKLGFVMKGLCIYATAQTTPVSLRIHQLGTLVSSHYEVVHEGSISSHTLKLKLFTIVNFKCSVPVVIASESKSEHCGGPAGLPQLLSWQSICLVRRMSLVRVPPEAAHSFLWRKRAVFQVLVALCGFVSATDVFMCLMKSTKCKPSVQLHCMLQQPLLRLHIPVSLRIHLLGTVVSSHYEGALRGEYTLFTHIETVYN